MEPDLDSLLEFESCGKLFPQFADRWEGAYAKARKLVDSLSVEGSGRIRVGLVSDEPLAFVSVFIAIARSEVDLFLLNPKWGKEEMDTAREVACLHFEVEAAADSELQLKGSLAKRNDDSVAMGVNKLRVMIPTGGSTGKIRFAIHDWSSLAAAVYGFQAFISCDRMAGHCVLPLYHVSGFMQLVRALLTMGSIVFGKLADFEFSHRLLLNEKPENRFLSLVATQLERLLRNEQNITRLREYRAVFIGGGPASAKLLEQAREARLPLAPTYGMTETAAQVATMLPERFLRGDEGQGKALPHVGIDIVEDGSDLLTVPAGQTGLIRVRGASLFYGYFGDANIGKRNLLVTSDLGRLDEGGGLTVLGRADQIVISGGEKINPREVEVALERSGLVSEVVCFGREDREWGQVLSVAYAPKDAAVTENALKDRLKQDLSSYKVPKIWIRLESIPRNEAGKIAFAQIEESIGA